MLQSRMLLRRMVANGRNYRDVPKLKTNKSAKRRFKVTGTGIVMRTKGMKSHLRRKKSKRVSRAFDRMFPVAPADEKRLKRALPYGL